MIINDEEHQLYSYKDLYDEVKHLEIILDKELK